MERSAASILEGQYKTWMVHACAEKGHRIYQKKNVDDRVAGQEEKRKAKEDVTGCCEGRHARGWRDQGRHSGQRDMETDNALW